MKAKSTRCYLLLPVTTTYCSNHECRFMMIISSCSFAGVFIIFPSQGTSTKLDFSAYLPPLLAHLSFCPHSPSHIGLQWFSFFCLHLSFLSKPLWVPARQFLWRINERMIFFFKASLFIEATLYFCLSFWFGYFSLPWIGAQAKLG